MIEYSAHATAVYLLNGGLWPVVIRPGEKRPIGRDWGLNRATEDSIDHLFDKHPTAGCGLCLGPGRGPGGTWLLDFEADGPEAEMSLLKLFGGSPTRTMSWRSTRGRHRLYTGDGDRLLKLLAAAGAKEGTGIKSGVWHLEALPDLEFRVGGYHQDGSVKQVQSVCPPTPGTDRQARQWMDGEAGVKDPAPVAEMPEIVYVVLEEIAERAAQVAADRAHEGNGRAPGGPPRMSTPHPGAGTYARAALESECTIIAQTIEGQRNNTLYRAAFKCGTLVGAGALARDEVEQRLLEAARRCGLSDQEAVSAIRSGLTAGEQLPRDLSRLASRDGEPSGTAAAAPPTDPPPWPPLQFSDPPRALPFPVDVFPVALQRFCRELAEATLAPVDFVGVAMLATAGAAIGQSVNIRTKRGWNEPPLLNVIIVAPPGKTKSPVIRAVVKPLSEIDRRLREDSARERAAWEERKKAHAKDDSKPPPGPEPPQLRAIVKDITRESLVIILADNPRGVLCDPDEASAWVASFNEYKGKGGSDRQFWLSVWGSAPVSVDRKGGRESTYVAFPFVPVLGGLPPDMLTSLRDDRGRDDGFLDRILFCYPDEFPPQRWTEQELSPEAETDWSDGIGRLFGVKMRAEGERTLPHLIAFTPEAKAVWVDWFNRHAVEMEGPEFSERHAGAWAKLWAHAARFALILSRIRLACDPCPPEGSNPHPPVAAVDAKGAVKLVDYFKSHLARIAHRMTVGMGNPDAKALAGWIKRHGLTTFRESEVREHLRRFREKPADLASAINALKALGAIRPRPEPADPGKRGPKVSPAYDVHPDLHGAPDNSANSSNSSPEAPAEPFGGIGGITGRFQESEGESPSDREVFEL